MNQTRNVHEPAMVPAPPAIDRESARPVDLIADTKFDQVSGGGGRGGMSGDIGN